MTIDGSPALTTDGATSLDDVVSTADLDRRPSRPANYEAENRALSALARVMADDPTAVLQKLVDAALELTGADSAGISVFEVDATGARVFRWRATAGAFAPFSGGTMPREFSPCGIVLDRNATQLMVDPVRYWPYIADLRPHVGEVLLVPFHDGDAPIGTVWVVAHGESRARRFDAEDERLVTSLSRFASAAVRTLGHLEALNAANRAKDRFLAVLSHELRTPLTPALLTATAMQDDDALPAPVREDARLIRRNIEMQTRLIDDLLDVSRLGAGKLKLRTETVDLAGVLRDCVAARGAAAGARPAVELRLSPGARHAVHGDPARLAQVFANLISNAVKFTPADGRVTVATSDAGTEGVRVEVRDSGCGIPAHVLPRVFDPFEQGGRETTRRFDGLGLGLAIAKGIVEAHGGQIAADSRGADAGTTMTVLLPTLAAEVPAAPPPARDGAASDGAGLSILLVEDHEDSLHAMTRLLRRLRFRVETATTVGGALEVAGRGNIDVLISDVGLPDGSGLDLMRAIRATRPIPGIALTGYGSAADIALTAEAGFTMHLTKPVRMAELQEAVRRVAGAAASATT